MPLFHRRTFIKRHSEKAGEGAGRGPEGPPSIYFPMQNVAKIRFKMSSAVVAPVIASIGRRAP